MHLLITIVITLQFLMGCRSHSDEPIENEVFGVYIFGHETSVINLCGTSEQWWADGDTDAMDSLIETHKSSGVGPYGNLYVTLRGEFRPIQDLGDYMGVFEVQEFIDYSVSAEDVLSCVPDIARLN